jgi:anti-sigma-K factor RskA
MSGSAEDRDLLAAEFVLGTLEGHEARTVELMAKTDQELAAAIAAWQERLAPLARVVPEQAPPRELWTRLQESTAPVVLAFPAAKPPPLVRAWRSTGVWRGTTAGALALAAAFAGLAFFHHSPEPASAPVFVAELTPTSAAAPLTAAEAAGQPAPPLAQTAASSSSEPNLAQPAVSAAAPRPEGFQQSAAAPAQTASSAGSTLAPAQTSAESPAPARTAGFLVARVPDGSVVVKPLGMVHVPSGEELELWALPPGAAQPKPEGVLPPGGMHVSLPGLTRANTKLMVSLEPAGTAPSAPTGRVVYSGTLTPLQ